ncbi:MAG: PEP-utilizing enzyme [Patescibacteria group bacterium]
MDIVERFKKYLGNEEPGQAAGVFSPLIAGGTFGHEWVTNLNRDYDFDWGPFVGLFWEKAGTYFFKLDSWPNTMRVGLRHYLKDEERMHLMQAFKQSWADTEALERQYPLSKLTDATDAELQSLLRRVFELAKVLLSTTIFAEMIEKEDIAKFYKEAGGTAELLDEFFETASLATFESVGLRMDEVLASDKSDAALQPYFSDYFITPTIEETSARRAKLLAEHGGVQGIQKEIGRIRMEVEQNKTKVAAHRALHAPGVQKIFDFMQLSAWVRDVRRKPFNTLFTLASEIAREMFRRAGMDPALAPYAFYDELAAGKLADPAYRTLLVDRPSGGVHSYIDAEGYVRHEGGTAQTREQLLAIFDAAHTTKEIKGAVAYRGHVHGKVQVIHGEKDFASFEKGSVLVTSMTRPEFVPLMKLASAIVTDEGGITCHAAIVSRELKKPCIIGTRNATRVLKTGDMVEVDAEKGVVRILK